MKNVQLIKGKCAVCGEPIDKKWAGLDPVFGTKCEQCSWKKGEVFGPDHVEIVVQRDLTFNPLFGSYGYRFGWEGSKVMVNDKQGTIAVIQEDGSYVRFTSDGREYRQFIKGLGYLDLLRIYKEQGGDTVSPSLNLQPYIPEKADLLKEPILYVGVRWNDHLDTIEDIFAKQIPRGPELPVLSMCHAFANFFVRHEFKLRPNFCSEGGFTGKNFEVRNHMSRDIYGEVMGIKVVKMAPCKVSEIILSPDEFAVRFNSLQAASSLVYEYKPKEYWEIVRGVDAITILSTWTFIITTLLRYDWRMERYETIEDIWRCYCRMQDILLNIMPLEKLQAVLDYAGSKRYDRGF